MSGPSLRSFERRVGLFVVLVAAYAVVLQGLHFLEGLAAHRRLSESVEARARLAARIVLEEADRDRLARSLQAWQARGARPALAVSRATLRELGLTSVELLSPEGWGLGTSIQRGPGRDGEHGRVDGASLKRLAMGEVVVDTESGIRGEPWYAIVTIQAPVLDEAGELAGVVAMDMAAEPLARSGRNLRSGLAIQGGSLLAFMGLLVLFTSWTLRPLRLLAATARGRDAHVAAELVARDDTGFVVETYRQVIEELREKEQELVRLRQLERHRADELQELNASIVDSMVSGVLVLDLSGRIRSLNDVARAVFATGDAPAVGRPFTEVLRDLPEVCDRLAACLERGLVIRRDELRLNVPGVGRRDVGLTLSPLKDREGGRGGALCLVVDLTEVKRLQERIRLQESLAELGELSAGIAHEFRNSLATILGYAKLVERCSEGEALEHSRDIQAEVAALRRVVDDFLRFANPTRLVLDRIPLADLLTELAEETARRSGASGATVTVAPGLPDMTGDETLLRRAFTNLFRNAAEAAGEEGRVEVSHESEPRRVTVHVDDDGPGIPEEERERVFVPFYSGKQGGTGLGLALVRKIVVHHGGEVRVGRSPLGGARFSVTLPLRGEREANGPGGSRRSHASQAGEEM